MIIFNAWMLQKPHVHKPQSYTMIHELLQCNYENTFLPVGTDRPKLKDLYRHVTPCCAAHWEDIGIYLDIELGHLKIIKTDHPGDSSGCCKELWKKWLEVDPDATWEKLFAAIDSAIPSISSSTGS